MKIRSIGWQLQEVQDLVGIQMVVRGTLDRPMNETHSMK